MNANIKCPQCGLINWADAETCKRCLATFNHNSAQGASYARETTTEPFGYSGFNPTHQRLDDMSYPSYSSYVPARSRDNLELATRGSRLFANLINVLCLIPIFLFAIFGGLLADSRGPGGGNGALAGMALVMILYVVGIVILQIYYLTTRGQTIGKKVMGIRIVKQETNENGGFVTNVVVREGATMLIANIPFVGTVLGLIDVLFIFREDQRCLHDMIAGTIVVKA